MGEQDGRSEISTGNADEAFEVNECYKITRVMSDCCIE